MAQADGISVEIVIVDDDVALKERGRLPVHALGGTTFIRKPVGVAVPTP